MTLATQSRGQGSLGGFHEGGDWVAPKPVSGPFIMTDVACLLSIGIRGFSLALLISVA